MVKKINWWLVGILTAFGLIFASISVVNHYLFRTGAFDYGLIHTLLYDFLHFNIPQYCSDYWNKNIVAFSDHFSPVLFILSPFYLIFGTYTMIVLTISAFLFGGYGVYKFCLLKTENYKISNWILLHFFVLWGFYSSLSFPGHLNDLAAMLVPWLFYYYERKDVKITIGIFLLIVFSKENLPLYVGFIFLGLIFRDWLKGFKINKIYIYLIAFSLIYFIVVLFWLMPQFSDSNQSFQLSKYKNLGTNGVDILTTLFKQPRYVFSLFFENPNPDIKITGIKSEFYYLLLMSGGLTFFIQPWYIVMIIPLLAQKMFHSDPALWGINYHYSIEFMPLISLSVIEFVAGIKNINWQKWLSIAFASTTLFLTISSLDYRRSKFFDPISIRFYQAAHYKTNLNIKEINKALELIPKNASVTASAKAYPHLAIRDTIYHFPHINKSTYIVLLNNDENSYPLKPEEYYRKMNELKKSVEYKIGYETKDLIIFNRNN